MVALAAALAGRVLPDDAAAAAAAVQAVAVGIAVAAGWPGRRAAALGGSVAALLLAAVAVGASVSPAAARAAPAGLGHALLYGALAWWFGRSLRPGRVAVVTGVAQRLNPRFRPGMIPYTRGVTAIWAMFAAGQVAANALLAATGVWSAWATLTGGGHALLAALLAVAEFAARRWRFPGEHTGFWETVRRFRHPS